MKRIYFTVTNDLSFDQRMNRICSSLSASGYSVVLVGRKLENSLPIQQKNFKQIRLKCLFNKGFAFYAEYNLRLFFFLLFKKMDAICAIDLDTILPVYLVSEIRGRKRIYDAHEFFSELKEVRSRPEVQKFWLFIERFALPRFKNGYTVSQGLADAFKNQYGCNYSVIRNLPVLEEEHDQIPREKFLLYQGAVNEGRGFEWLIPAMRNINYPLVICGDGNFMNQLKKLIEVHEVQNKIELRGMLPPDALLPIARKASLGIGLAEKEGINQFHALPNKFLDYMHAGLPQLAMNFPEYKRINQEYKIAVLLDELSIDLIEKTVNETMINPNLLEELQRNCVAARKIFSWQNEEKVLLDFYHKLFEIV